MRSSKKLIEKLRPLPDELLKILHNNRPAEMQISDVNTYCWAAIQLIFLIQEAVSEELYGTEDDA